MKYAVISDIHGNSPALRLALADAKAQGAEGFLFAGDYSISAPWAGEVIALMRSLPNARFICGNDESHLDVPPGDDGQYEVSRWCASTLTEADRAFLAAMPEEASFVYGGVRVRMAHSSEHFFGKHLHERFRTSLLPRLYPEGKIGRDELLADFRAWCEQGAMREAILALPPGVYVFGHNHIQAHAEVEGRVLVNPGSCGLPLDGGDFCCAYTLLTIEDSAVGVEERRLPMDADALIAQVKQTPQYAAARVWSELIFDEWRTCREKVYYFLHHCEQHARAAADDRRPFARETWEAAYRSFRLPPFLDPMHLTDKRSQP